MTASTSTHDHPTAAAEFTADDARAHWHDQALWFVRVKRDRMAQSLPEWETLRERAGEIKAHVIANLADYLEQFEREATRRGAVVHWARDAAEHNEIVLRILRERGVRRVAKGKSMLTEECHLNPFLERHDIEVVDTDLGEWIVQLRGEPPSHIVLPAIHIKKEEVGELFHEKLGTAAGAVDPIYLAGAARERLREVFLAAEAGVTGVNFAIAETGGLVVCTNEGNADLGVSLPKLHIACLGIEKLIPRTADLGVFLRLLGRSATGQPITAYSSHFHGPRPGGELHIVLVDNGRSELLARSDFRSALHCIRCGACMNTCPVYRRSGGHSYGATVPGPIGSILNPARDIKQYATLPYACSLCASCTDVCPVKINLHEQLLYSRREVVQAGQLPWTKRLAMKGAAFVFARPRLYSLVGRVARWSLRTLPRRLLYSRLNPWGKQRDFPPAPRRSFRDEWRARASDERPRGDSGPHSPGSAPAAPLPELAGDWIRYADREAQFASVLASVGGAVVTLDEGGDLEGALRGLPCLADAKEIVCQVPGVALGNVDLDQVDDPHQLDDVDVAIMPGEFAVAENGAVWTTDRGVRQRVVYFLTQHLVLVVPRREIVHNLHEAYQRLRFEGAGYGLFISGPSKTADIEQSLVIGAHGPRSLTVVLVP